jgi:predicted transcriptional regulator
MHRTGRLATADLAASANGRIEGERYRDDVASRYPDRAMATAKQDARKILDGLPEEASLEDIQYHLYVLQRIERGREDVAAGRVVSQDDVEQRLARWLDK